MARRRGGSIRLWQTELFIVVIVVAMLILSGSLSAGLETILTRTARDSELRNVSAIARRLEPELPATAESAARIRDVVTEFRAIYGGGIWVYDHTGTLLESSYDVAPPSTAIEAAMSAGLADGQAYSDVQLRPGGWVIASRPLRDNGAIIDGVVVTASPVDTSLAILDAVRSRLWATFWISLVIAGLLGFGFSELIGRRIRRMSQAAAAIAGGDFEQRLPESRFVPDEIRDLAESYNTMAVTLGETFGELHESQRRLSAVIEGMAEGVVAFDASGAVEVVNAEAQRLLGLTARPVQGVAAEELIDDPAVLDTVRTALSGSSAGTMSTLGTFTVMLHCTPLLDAAEEVAGAVLLLADVTEQARVQEAQRRFVADASHEMRTPLAALKGMLELLEDGAKDVPEVRDDFIRTMQVEADRLGRLVSDLLTLAQLESGSLRLRLEPQFAADLLGDVYRVMCGLAEQAGVQLVLNDPDTDTRVLADRDKVVQVLLSFTDNALKHSPAGTTITLIAEQRGEVVRFAVADEGPGIEPEQLARVFERFYRADAARAGGGGTGLGLAIAKEIVEAHGASVEVSSAPGCGTSFSFELPVS